MIKQTEANFEALIESTQELIWAVGLDYRLTLLNSSLQQRFQDSYGVRLEVGIAHSGLSSAGESRVLDSLL